jgi:hypothetical protein
MKTIKLLTSNLLLVFASCTSVRVYSDFDNKVDFTPIKPTLFTKTGIDKAEISIEQKNIERN